MSNRDDWDLVDPKYSDELEPLADEEQYIGMESHLVPKVPPGYNPNVDRETCNAKKTDDIQDEQRGTLTLFGGWCRAPPGRGTDHNGEGRCSHHGGVIGDQGAPKHNQNARTSGIAADPHHFAQSLGSNERDHFEALVDAITNRVKEYKGQTDFLDEVLARRIAINLHMVAKESDYVENVSGLTDIVQHEHGSHEKEAALLEDVRQRDKDIFNMLKKLGILNDPETKKADALDEWRQFVEAQDPPSDVEVEFVDDG